MCQYTRILPRNITTPPQLVASIIAIPPDRHSRDSARKQIPQVCFFTEFSILLFTRVCNHVFTRRNFHNVLQYTGTPCPRTVTGFCRCFAFRIGKIHYHHCIVRNFQFRKFLPMKSNHNVSSEGRSYISLRSTPYAEIEKLRQTIHPPEFPVYDQSSVIHFL